MNKRFLKYTPNLLIVLFTISQSHLFAQSSLERNDWWATKYRSIFQLVDDGMFSGTTTGYIQFENGKDSLVLDFQSTKTNLDIIKDLEEVYDNSTKKYSTRTTDGKTKLTYETYAMANILKINLNGEDFSIGIIDGACDTPILGLRYNYCSGKNIEYLTLFATKPLELTNTEMLIKKKGISYPEAKKIANSIIILPGSTLVLTIRK